MSFDSPPPERTLSGVVRSPARRSHQSRPYTRPGLGLANGLSTPTTNRTLRRSGSEGGMFGGLKSLFSRPLQWLSTPTRPEPVSLPSGVKRDDPEDPPSPTQLRASKRLRRLSPSRVGGPYDPASNQVGVLPSLPPHVSLSRRSNRNSLPASTSMPYLDPPRSVLAPSSPRTSTLGRRSHTIGRSYRMDLASLADEDGPEPAEDNTRDSRRRTLGASSGDAWSPWGGREGSVASSATPRRSLANAFPSSSPFTATRSGGLSRSHTMSGLSNHAREPSVAASDLSTGRSAFNSLGRSRLRASSSMRFDSLDEDRMSGISETSERTERASVRELFADRAAVRAGLTPQASRRLPTLPQPAVHAQPAPIRKGQMVWDGERGFVRESDVAAAPQPVAQNDAERILQALEAQRKPAQPITSSSGLPSSLVGASSRTIRKAIAVPLATSEPSRKRHGGDWLQDSASAAISPYGRRRVVDEAARKERRQRREARRAESESDMEVDGSVRSSASVASTSVTSVSASSTRTRSQRSHSRQSSDMSVSDRSVTPPRRSTRSRKGTLPTVDETPKPVRRSTRLRKEPESTTPAKSPRASKKSLKSPEPTPRSRRRKATTPPPEREPTPPRPVPVLTTTAPSPTVNKSDGYQVRDDSAPRERSSLRAGAERKHRAHQGAASYNSSRATSPSGGGTTSGRFSARDEDLPTMEEVEAASVPIPSFKGFSMPLFGQDKDKGKEKEKESSGSDNDAAPLSSRIGIQPPASAPQTGGSLSVPTGSIGRTPLTRLGSGLSTRPRASSPLAASSITAEPDSPQSKAKESKSTPVEPPAGGFFSLAGSTPTAALTPTGSTTPAGKPPVPVSDFFVPPKTTKTSSLGLGKPSAPADGPMPNFFASASSTPPAAPAPSPAPVFDFGIKAASEQPKPASTFSFGDKPAASAEKPAAPFNFGTPAKPTEGTAPKAFDFGSASSTTADKPAESSKPSGGFNFGSNTSATPSTAEKPAEAPKVGGFNFGSNSSAAAEPPKTGGFNFGSNSSAAPADKPAEAPKTGGFNFGQSSEKPAEAPKTAGFSFGAPAGTAADKIEPKMTFGAAAEKPKPAESTPFNFGSSKPAEPAATSFSFGAPAATNGSATPTNGDKPASVNFGSSAPTAPASVFNFGSKEKAPAPSAPAETPSLNSGSQGFSFGSSAPAANGDKGGFSFGSASAAPAPASATSSTFSFGSNANASAPASATGFGSATTPNTASSGFGASSATPTSSTFSFGSKPAAPSSTFGSSTSTGTGFGSTTTPPATGFGAQTSGGFGNTATQPPASQGFNFGGSSSTPASGGFGSTSNQPASSGFGNTGGFGSTASAPAAPANGFNASSGFGSSAPSAGFGSNAPTTSPFQFGSNPPSGSTTPSAAPAAPFSFGASAPAPAAAPASSGFTFGAPSTASSTNQPFQFGSSSSTFGSPTPSHATTTDGGFSLGQGSAPASPGARKIKPLRRGAVKR